MIKDYFKENPSMLGIKADGFFYIKNATDLGYLIAEVFDGIDLSYMGQNTRRGRGQKRMSQTITCSGSLGVVVYDERWSDK